MSDREKRCNAMGRRLAAAPIDTWGHVFDVFGEEGFSTDEVAQAIEANACAVLLAFLRCIEPHALRAAAGAQVLENIGDYLREHKDVKGGRDA